MKVTAQRLARLEQAEDPLSFYNVLDLVSWWEANNQESVDLWIAEGCQGPIPSPCCYPQGFTEAEWDEFHRSLTAVKLRADGLPLPAGFTDAERTEIETIVAVQQACEPVHDHSPASLLPRESPPSAPPAESPRAALPAQPRQTIWKA